MRDKAGFEKMIEPGTKIKIPAGIQFFSVSSGGRLEDYRPTKQEKTVVFKYVTGPEICFKSGYAKVSDLIAAGIIGESDGELFVVEENE